MKLLLRQLLTQKIYFTEHIKNWKYTGKLTIYFSLRASKDLKTDSQKGVSELFPQPNTP